MKRHEVRKSKTKRHKRPVLTARERKIVDLAVDGFKDNEIAQRMLLPEQTVKNELRKIFSNLGVSDRLELVFYAIDNKLVSPWNTNGQCLPPGRAAQSTSLQEILEDVGSKLL